MNHRSGSKPLIRRTRDADEARALLSDRYKPHRMRRLADEKRFDFIHMSARVPEGSFNVLGYGSAVEIRPDRFGDFFMLEMPLEAGVDLAPFDGEAVSSTADTALFINPSMHFASTWRSGCTQLQLKVSNHDVLSRWQAMTNDPGAALPMVAPAIDLSTDAGWRLRQIMLLLQQEFDRSVASGRDTLSTTPLSGAALDAVLACLRDRRDTPDPATALLPAPLKRCVAHIRDHLAEDLSVPVLIRVAQCSERNLFNLFHRFLETTPRAFIREERLRAARDTLLSGHVGVAEAACAAGFAHMGRFASLYRARYGEAPSSTRRR